MSSIRASHLLIKHKGSRNPVSRRTGQPTNLSLADAIQQLEDIQKNITVANFFDYAQKYSDCSSFNRGGDLGFFGHGQMQKSFETAAYALNVGEISSIVHSDSGVHLIYRTA